MVKRVAKWVLGRAGLEVRRVRRRNEQTLVGNRGSLTGSLLQVRASGFAPATCIDVGAAFGKFTLECAQIFPKADYPLVEPVDEYRPFLESVTAQLPRA